MAKRVSTDNRKLTAKDILATQSASDRTGAKPFSEIDVTPAVKDIDSLQKQVAEMTPSQPSQEALIDPPMPQTTLGEVIGDKPVQESTSMFGRARDNLQKDIQDLKKQRIDEAKKDIASQDQATQQLYQETWNKEHTKDMEELDSILKESERIQKDIDAGVSVTETDKALERLNKRKARLLDANARETDVIKRFRRNVEIKKITDAFDGLEKLKNVVKGKEKLSSAFGTVGKLFQLGTDLIDEWSEKKKETKETANVALETKTGLGELRGDIANIDGNSEIAKLQDTKGGKKLDLNTLRFMKSLTGKLRNDIFQNIFLHNYIIEILRNPSLLSNWQDVLDNAWRQTSHLFVEALYKLNEQLDNLGKMYDTVKEAKITWDGFDANRVFEKTLKTLGWKTLQHFVMSKELYPDLYAVLARHAGALKLGEDLGIAKGLAEEMGVDPDLVASQVYISDMIELKRALRRLYKSQQGANGTTKQGTIALDMWIELKEAIVKANPEVGILEKEYERVKTLIEKFAKSFGIELDRDRKIDFTKIDPKKLGNAIKYIAKPEYALYVDEFEKLVPGIRMRARALGDLATIMKYYSGELGRNPGERAMDYGKKAFGGFLALGVSFILGHSVLIAGVAGAAALMLFLNKQISAIAFFKSIGSLKSNEIEQLKGLQKKMEDRENLSIEDKKLYIELSAHFTSLVYREIAIEEQRAQRKEAIVENYSIRREAGAETKETLRETREDLNALSSFVRAERYALAEVDNAVRAIEDQTIDLLAELAIYTKTYPKDIVALMAEEMDADEFMDWMAQLPDEVVLDNADDIKRIFGNMELYEKFKEENKGEEVDTTSTGEEKDVVESDEDWDDDDADWDDDDTAKGNDDTAKGNDDADGGTKGVIVLNTAKENDDADGDDDDADGGTPVSAIPKGAVVLNTAKGNVVVNRSSTGLKKKDKFDEVVNLLKRHGFEFNMKSDLNEIIKEGDYDFTKEELTVLAEYEGRSGNATDIDGKKSKGTTEYYTPYEMAELIRKTGIKRVKFLSKKLGIEPKFLANEPSAGSGRFVGLAPKQIKTIVVTDMNGINQVILKALYSHRIVFGSESGDYFLSIDKYDDKGELIRYNIIAGNPPYMANDSASAQLFGQSSLQHNFVNVAVDQLAPNGVASFILQSTDIVYDSNLKKFGDNVIIEEVVLFSNEAFPGFQRPTAMITVRKRQDGEAIQNLSFSGLFYNENGSRRLNSMGEPIIVMASKYTRGDRFQHKIGFEPSGDLKTYLDSMGMGHLKAVGGQLVDAEGPLEAKPVAGEFERLDIEGGALRLDRFDTSKHFYNQEDINIQKTTKGKTKGKDDGIREDVKLKMMSVENVEPKIAYRALVKDGEQIAIDGEARKLQSVDGDKYRIIKTTRQVEIYKLEEIKEIIKNAQSLDVWVDYSSTTVPLEKAKIVLNYYNKYKPSVLKGAEIVKISTLKYKIEENGGLVQLMLSRDNIANPEVVAKQIALAKKFGGNVAFNDALDEVKGKFDIANMQISLDPSIEGVVYHEFGHMWEALLEKDSPIIHKEGMDLVKDSEYMNDSRLDIYKEHGISEDALAQEALAFAIQDAGLKFENMSKRAKFLHWLKRAFRNLTRKFGLTKMKLEDFVDQAVADINTGLEKKYKDAMKELQDALREGGINIDSELHLLQAEPEMTDEQLQEIKNKNEKRLKNRYGDRFSEIRHRYSKYFTKPDFYDVLSKILPIKKDAGFLIEKNAEYIGSMIEEHYKLVEEEDGDQKINNGLEVAKELLEQNQYTFYADNVNVENLLDWNKYKDIFLDDYKEGEVICTMRDPDRGDAVFLMHIRHKNIENIPHANELTQDNLKDSPEWQSYLKRNNRYDKKTNTYDLAGLKPNINDPYSSSSMALQIPRKGQKAPTKLISRYNHTVGSPDAVYNLNFDRVAKGLSQAIYSATDRMDLITKNKKIYLNHGNTILVKGSLYKYIQEYNSVYFGEGYLIVNEELRNTFDPGNYLAIDEGMGYINKNTGELYFLNRDMEGAVDRNKVLENPMYAFIKNDGDRVEKVSNGVFKYISKGNRQMTYDINQKKLTIDDSKYDYVHQSDARLLTQTLEIDHLEIIANGGDVNLQQSGIDFYGLGGGIWSGVSLKSLTIKNATTLMGDDIGIDSVGILNLENVSAIEGYMFGDLISAGEIYAPNLLSIKGSIINSVGPFFSITKVDKASFPKLIEVQSGNFLGRITDVSGVEFGDGVLRKVGNGFLRYAIQLGPKTYLNGLVEVGDNALSNIDMEELSFPKLISVGNYFMSHSENIKKIDLPKLISVGDNFMSDLENIKKIDLPKLETAGDNFFRHIKNIEEISLPNLKKVGNSALHYYPLSEITLPKLENVGGLFMSEAPNLKKANFPVLKRAEEEFMNDVQLEEFVAPKLKFMGGFSLANSKIKDLYLPNLIRIGNFVFNANHLVKVSLPSLKDAGNMFLGSIKESSTLKSVNLENFNFAASFFLANQVGLEEVNLPKLQYVGLEAFKKAGIKQLILPSLERAYSKFGAHSQLEYLDAPLLSSAEDNFLMGTEELRSVNLPSLKYLQHNAFNYSNVIELDLPKLTTIKAGSFQNMPRLSRAKFVSVREIESNVFKNTNATEIYMPKLEKGILPTTKITSNISDYSKPLKAVRYYNKGFETSDSVRGGTWYTIGEENNYKFNLKNKKATQQTKGIAGGTIRKEAELQLKKPLVVKDALLEDGSFAVINNGYEDWLPKTERKLAEDLYHIGRDAENDTEWRKLVTAELKKADFTDAQIKAAMDSPNKGDALMDMVVSRGLRKEGYDSLILENTYKGEVVDRHLFKLADTPMIK